MKLESKETAVMGQIGLKSSEASISQEDIDKLYKLIEAPYKRPISSIVREYTSNAVDAHNEAKVDDAVIVELSKSEEIGYYISFNDVGVGMSEHRMATVFVKLLKSTKELTNDAIGAFGMGSKAGLSYNDFFFIETIFDGQYYKYIYRKGEKRPTLDLLVQEDTSERNGTKFIVPIKSENDVLEFARACNSQLHYFENVVYNYESLSNFLYAYNYEEVEELLDNDFKLYKGKNFVLRIHKNDQSPSKRELHILNGPVYYPIDFNNISGISHVKDLPIGLTFNIGELDVIQTREDVRYNEKTVAAIKKKLDDALNELKELYGTDDILHTKTYNEYVQKAEYAERNTLVLGKGEYVVSLRHSDVFPSKRVVFTPFYNIASHYVLPTNLKRSIYSRFVPHKELTCTSLPTVRALSVDGSEGNRTYSNGVRTHSSMYHIIMNTIAQGESLPKMIITENRDAHSIKLNKQIAFKDKEEAFAYAIPLFYLKEAVAWNNKDPKSFEHRYYSSALHLEQVDDKTKDAIVGLYLKMSQKYIDNVVNKPSIINYDTLKLDEKWYSAFAAKYRKKAGERDTTKINIKVRQRNNYGNNIWDTQKVTMHDLANMHKKYTIFYTHHDNKEALEIIGFDGSYYSTKSLFTNTAMEKRPIKLISLAPTHYKKIVKLVADKSNYYTIDEYMDNKDNIKFKYLADIYVYHKLNTTELKTFIEDASGLSPAILKTINEEFYTLVNEIQKHVDDIESHYNIRGINTDKIINDIEGLADFAEIKKYYILQKIERIRNYYPYFNHFIRLLERTGGFNIHAEDAYGRLKAPEIRDVGKENIDYIASTLALTNYTRLGIVRPEVYEDVDTTEYNELVAAVEREKVLNNILTTDYLLGCVRIKKYEIKNNKLI